MDVQFTLPGLTRAISKRILYPSQKVFILTVMKHAEYDEDKWKEDCGCYEPPPHKSKSARTSSTAKPKKRGK
jgi:hypothetical protein